MHSVLQNKKENKNNMHLFAPMTSGIMIGFMLANIFHQICYSQITNGTASLPLYLSLYSEDMIQLQKDKPAISTKTVRRLPEYNWPGVAVSELGHPLVYKGSNFVENTRALTFQYLDEFLQVYKERPDKVNICGMRINHGLAVYLTVKVLQPTTIIESGVNAGQSTYFARAAAPHAKIISIDPAEKPICGQKVRWIDSQGPTDYLTGPSFQDLGAIDWKSKIDSGEIDPETTFVLLDDHMVVFDRLAILMKFGFRHVLLDDNYKVNEGATSQDRAGFTPKQMFHRVDNDSKFLWNNLLSYAEFPPLVAPILAQGWTGKRSGMGGFMVATDTNMDIVPPILNAHITGNDDYNVYERICREIGLNPLLQDRASYMQIMHYNQITYMELGPFSPRLQTQK